MREGVWHSERQGVEMVRGNAPGTARHRAPRGKLVQEGEWDEDKHAHKVDGTRDSAHRLRDNWAFIRPHKHTTLIAPCLWFVQVNAINMALDKDGDHRKGHVVSAMVAQYGEKDVDDPRCHEHETSHLRVRHVLR